MVYFTWHCFDGFREGNLIGLFTSRAQAFEFFGFETQDNPDIRVGLEAFSLRMILA